MGYNGPAPKGFSPVPTPAPPPRKGQMNNKTYTEMCSHMSRSGRSVHDMIDAGMSYIESCAISGKGGTVSFGGKTFPVHEWQLHLPSRPNGPAVQNVETKIREMRTAQTEAAKPEKFTVTEIFSEISFGRNEASASRKFKVYGSRGFHDRNPMEVDGIPRYDDPHPSMSGLFASEISADAFETTRHVSIVNVLYSGKQQKETPTVGGFPTDKFPGFGDSIGATNDANCEAWQKSHFKMIAALRDTRERIMVDRALTEPCQTCGGKMALWPHGDSQTPPPLYLFKCECGNEVRTRLHVPSVIGQTIEPPIPQWSTTHISTLHPPRRWLPWAMLIATMAAGAVMWWAMR